MQRYVINMHVNNIYVSYLSLVPISDMSHTKITCMSHMFCIGIRSTRYTDGNCLIWANCIILSYIYNNFSSLARRENMAFILSRHYF